MRFTDAQAAPIKAEWETQKTQITGVLHRAIVLTVIALLLFVFLLFVTGRKPEDEDVHLVTIDRLPVEVNVLCFWAVLGTAGGLNLALMGELLNGTNDMSILLVPSILFFVAAFAFALELTLSLVRVIKNRSFVKQCWSIRFILWCWRTFIKVCKCIWQSFGKLRRMLFCDYKNAQRCAALYGVFGCSRVPCGGVRRSGRLVLSSCSARSGSSRQVTFSSNASPALNVSWMRAAAKAAGGRPRLQADRHAGGRVC